MIYPTADELRAAKGRRGGPPMDRWMRSYVIEPNGCWRWTKSITGRGYGHFHILGTYYQAHRIAYILYRGAIAPGLEIDHLCRNRWCVNPGHLEPVLHAVNVWRGAATRLTAAQVWSIRRSLAGGTSQRALAREIGIDHSAISRLVRGSRWALLDQEATA